MMAFHDEGVEMMVKAENTTRGIINVDAHPRWDELSPTEEARSYVQNIPAPNGFRAWRELARWYDRPCGADEVAAMRMSCALRSSVRRTRTT